MLYRSFDQSVHIGAMVSQVTSKMNYNVTHSDDYTALHCGTVYTEITPLWAQRRVLISVSVLGVNMMM